MSKTIYRLGSAAVGILGDHPVLDAVRAEIEPARVDDATAPELEIEVVPALSELAGPVRSLGNVDASMDEVRLHLPIAGFTMAIRRDEPQRVRVEVGEFATKFGMPHSIFHVANPTFLTSQATQAYLFVVGVLEPLIMMAGTSTAFLHAAAVSHRGRGVLLTSAGGVGKTTTAMELLQRAEWSFLSDDIALLDADAQQIRLHPRKAMVYEYNVADDADLRRRVTGPGMASALHWRCHSKLPGSQPRRRVGPVELHGSDSVAPEAALDHVFFLVRGERGASFDVQPLSVTDLVDRSRAIIETEFRNHLDLIRLWEATGWSWVSRETMMNDQSARLAKAVGGADLHQLTIPTGADVARSAGIVADLTTD